MICFKNTDNTSSSVMASEEKIPSRSTERAWREQSIRETSGQAYNTPLALPSSRSPLTALPQALQAGTDPQWFPLQHKGWKEAFPPGHPQEAPGRCGHRWDWLSWIEHGANTARALGSIPLWPVTPKLDSMNLGDSFQLRIFHDSVNS